MRRDWRIRINDALKAIKYIKQDTGNIEYDEFVKNRVIRQATERNIELVGEALNGVPKDVQEKYKNVDWRNIVGMRNYLIHQYFDAVPDIEWEVATVHIVELEKQLEEILEEENYSK